MMDTTYNVGIYCRLSNDDERDGESAAVVRQIFQMRQSGMAYGKITAALNEKGILLPAGTGRSITEMAAASIPGCGLTQPSEAF